MIYEIKITTTQNDSVNFVNTTGDLDINKYINMAMILLKCPKNSIKKIVINKAGSEL